MVEIDPMVVEVCREFFPQTTCKLEDPRVHIHFEDGLRFVRSKEDQYDLIIVDSTDPFGPGEGLFTREFYGNCYKALRPEGIMVNQHEAPIMKNMRSLCAVLTVELWTVSQFAGYIRLISLPILPVIGYLVLHPKNTTQYSILTRQLRNAGRPWDCIPGITTQSCTKAALRCPPMSKNCCPNGNEKERRESTP